MNCTNNKDINEKLNYLKNVNYSEFQNTSIVTRGAYDFVTYQNKEYKIKRNVLTKNIKSIQDTETGNSTKLTLSDNDRKKIENLLRDFDKLKVQSLSVDENSNVFLLIPWYEKCTYSFLRLMPPTTLKHFYAESYSHYSANWYVDKRCSE